jgi:hypothetical protein
VTGEECNRFKSKGFWSREVVGLICTGASRSDRLEDVQWKTPHNSPFQITTLYALRTVAVVDRVALSILSDKVLRQALSKKK